MAAPFSKIPERRGIYAAIDAVFGQFCASSDENAKKALEQLPKLKGCEAHCSVIISEVDQKVMRKLKINLTCEPKYQSQKLFRNS